jgi:hypothetical protein
LYRTFGDWPTIAFCRRLLAIQSAKGFRDFQEDFAKNRSGCDCEDKVKVGGGAGEKRKDNAEAQSYQRFAEKGAGRERKVEVPVVGQAKERRRGGLFPLAYRGEIVYFGLGNRGELSTT